MNPIFPMFEEHWAQRGSAATSSGPAVHQPRAGTALAHRKQRAKTWAVGREGKPSWRSLLVGRTLEGDRLLRQTGAGLQKSRSQLRVALRVAWNTSGAGTKPGLVAPAVSHRPYLFCPLLGVGHKVCCRAGHVCKNPKIRKPTGLDEDEAGGMLQGLYPGPLQGGITVRKRDPL